MKKLLNAIVLVTATITTISCKVCPSCQTENDTIGYRPVDPIPVSVFFKPDNSKTSNSYFPINTYEHKDKILKSLSSETMNYSVRESSMESNVNYGGATIGVSGKSYEVIVDYMKYSSNSVGIVYLTKQGKNLIKPEYMFNDDISIERKINELNKANPSDTLTRVSFPITIGIGLRIKASIRVTDGKVDLGSLFAIGAAAKANNLSGSLTVQTLGITGKEVTDLIPIGTEVSYTSIQNALLAINTIKSKIYDTNTILTPVCVGFYSNPYTKRGDLQDLNNYLHEVKPYMQIDK